MVVSKAQPSWVQVGGPCIPLKFTANIARDLHSLQDVLTGTLSIAKH